MKKIFYLGCLALLFSCTNPKEVTPVISVTLPPEGEELVVWPDRFPDMEMICLTGENRPIFTAQSNLIVKNGIYHVIDPYSTRQIHRFNQTGEYLNSIGAFGRGPNEYLDLTDVTVDDNGNVSVYSQHAGVLLIYSPDGVCLERKELAYATERFISHQGFNYHYIGTASKDKRMDYRLYVTDNSGQTVGEFLPAPKVPALPNINTFSLIGNTLYLCPAEGNDIYQLHKDKIDTLYRFDFGKYNLPNEYYQCPDLLSIGEFLKGRTVVYKLEFWENNDCAIFEGMRQTGFEVFNPFCGILDKQKGTWKWFNFNIDSFFFRYLDDQYAYFIADPEMIKQIPGLAERFPRLSTLTISDGMVIFKAKTKNINL